LRLFSKILVGLTLTSPLAGQKLLDWRWTPAAAADDDVKRSRAVYLTQVNPTSCVLAALRSGPASGTAPELSLFYRLFHKAAKQLPAAARPASSTCCSLKALVPILELVTDHIARNHCRQRLPGVLKDRAGQDRRLRAASGRSRTAPCAPDTLYHVCTADTETGSANAGSPSNLDTRRRLEPRLAFGQISRVVPRWPETLHIGPS
jgi:hypothetical protein